MSKRTIATLSLLVVANVCKHPLPQSIFPDGVTMIDIAEFFELHHDQYLKYSDIPPIRKRSNRPDLNALILLDRLVPGYQDIVSSSHHDEIYLEVSVEQLVEAASEDDLLDLIRSGVRYDSDVEALCMFV